MKAYCKENLLILSLLGSAIFLFLLNLVFPIFIDAGSDRRRKTFLLVAVLVAFALNRFRWARISLGCFLIFLASLNLSALLVYFRGEVNYWFLLTTIIALATGLLLLISKKYKLMTHHSP